MASAKFPRDKTKLHLRKFKKLSLAATWKVWWGELRGGTGREMGQSTKDINDTLRGHVLYN